MRPVRALLIYLLIVFVGGALLAPALYFLVLALADDFSLFADLSKHSFHRYVNRSMLVLTVAGLWPLVRVLGMTDRREFGFGPLRFGFCDLRKGIVIGLFSLGIAGALAVLGGARKLNFNHTTAEVAQHFALALVAAVMVGILEEIIFRGVLFGGLRKSNSWKAALLVSTFVYALFHFFAKPPQPAEVTWTTGFWTLGQMLRGFVDVRTLFPGFLNLFVAGAILATAYQYSGTLYLPIGIHAGWIFSLKTFGFLTAPVEAGSWMWGSTKLIDGWASCLVLLATLSVLTVKGRKRVHAV